MKNPTDRYNMHSSMQRSNVDIKVHNIESSHKGDKLKDSHNVIIMIIHISPIGQQNAFSSSIAPTPLFLKWRIHMCMKSPWILYVG